MITKSMKTLGACFILFTLLTIASSQSPGPICPFNYILHFGDGVTDIGNSVLLRPSLPPSRLPYGITFPGKPNGRWSDGLIDFDFGANGLGVMDLVPYLSKNFTSSKGISFSVGRSPVLARKFFTSRGVKIPSYAVSLDRQFQWFNAYLKATCSTEEACASVLRNALIIFGDNEGNDIGYPLSQGKSIKEVKTYVPFITRAQIGVARELIKMGATRIVIPGSAPLGCFPFILTARATNDPTAYDSLGCLKDVNDLNTLKNNDLQQAVANLNTEFPALTIFYGTFDQGVLQVINKTSFSNRDIALKSCCGIGGKYNYNEKKFCGRQGVPVCSNPKEYIFWDGLHLTQEASRRIVQNQIAGALAGLNCTA